MSTEVPKMKCTSCLILIFVFGIWRVSKADEDQSSRRKLLVLMIDGWRWDYSLNSYLNGFNRLEQNGVKAEYVTPVFPSNTYPNWYTLVTGLYAEHHGIVQNYMFDEEKQDYFLMGSSKNDSSHHWWNKAEPIWITTEKNSLKSAMFKWDGCHASIKGWKPTFCRNYRESNLNLVKLRHEFRQQLGEALNLLSGDFHLAMVYYEGIDIIGHKYGPYSIQLKNEVKEISRIIDNLQDEIEQSKIKNELVLMICSDHGMAVTEKNDKSLIQLEDYVNMDDILYILDKGSFAMIQPAKNKIEKVYKDLKGANINGLQIFHKEELAEKYGLKGNRLVLPILLMTEEGYAIQKLQDSKKHVASDSDNLGNHGYDPYKSKDMRTIFYASGPGLKKGHVAPPLEMVDIYNLMCHILEISALPNNGSWSRIQNVLDEDAVLHFTTLLLFVMFLLCFLSATLLSKKVFKTSRKQD